MLSALTMTPLTHIVMSETRTCAFQKPCKCEHVPVLMIATKYPQNAIYFTLVVLISFTLSQMFS